MLDNIIQFIIDISTANNVNLYFSLKKKKNFKVNEYFPQIMRCF